MTVPILLIEVSDTGIGIDPAAIFFFFCRGS